MTKKDLKRVLRHVPNDTEIYLRIGNQSDQYYWTDSIITEMDYEEEDDAQPRMSIILVHDIELSV